MKNSLQGFTSIVTAAKDRISELKDEKHNNSLQQKRLEKNIKINDQTMKNIPKEWE